MGKERVNAESRMLKKYEVVELNNVLSGVKIGKVSKECAFALLDVKIELTKVVKEIEEMQRTASEELKPEELKKEGAEESKDEGMVALKKRWNNKFMDFVRKRMDEEVAVKLESISRDDIYELTVDNNLNIQQIEVMMMLALPR